ncbi:glutamate--tRNA ligase [Arthrobacter agilis]|uniref:glutamate--tRNA ligase n=1 Tax=Arthrobacter agilis TaxID=37921 RepID=UPI000B355650|nr:glutamate--tRNA ligase [Arthrobacter agilis]OUM44228.1 glutamate--tRNA ligase [Arthrobacter agilis]PPB46603.1 glutamate--tRNA ligase [Arthrobacter agilis]TPV23738.1 glutamate--tRNA ligase [Arthrobacter agilis]VDR32466.1 Glutamate--tRNA ligase [Arthrobacter agilis]
MTISAELPVVTDATPVRVRFCPSPTGTPHVGLIRTALFNWAYARHTGGKLVFRIEDTDAARDSEESYQQLLESMTWLGIDWDEGVEVGGPHAPYRQSQRGDLYRDVIERLTDAGHLYESFSTPEEVEERHRAAGRDVKLGYDNHDRELTEEQKDAFRAAGRPAVLRLRMPDEDITFTDLVRGDITFRAGSVPDFAVVRANGAPLYTLVNPVDDALMGITHVLRGEDLLSSTPRQVALYRALIDIGVAKYMPLFGHLPYVMGQGNKKLSKRDPESNLFLHRERGFIREGLLNYLSLLGWSLSADEDIFSVDQLVEKFDVRDVLANPARFDLKKAEAINGTHVRLLDPAEFRSRLLPYLAAEGVIGSEPTDDELRIVAAAAPLIQERITLLGEAPDMLAFLFKEDDAVDIADDARKGLPANLAEILDATLQALEACEQWDADSLQAALRGALVDTLGLKPRLAFGPVRTAMSGRRISPPLFESMVILGRESSLSRVRALRATAH